MKKEMFILAVFLIMCPWAVSHENVKPKVIDNGVDIPPEVLSVLEDYSNDIKENNINIEDEGVPKDNLKVSVIIAALIFIITLLILGIKKFKDWRYVR